MEWLYVVSAEAEELTKRVAEDRANNVGDGKIPKKKVGFGLPLGTVKTLESLQFEATALRKLLQGKVGRWVGR